MSIWLISDGSSKWFEYRNVFNLFNLHGFRTLCSVEVECALVQMWKCKQVKSPRDVVYETTLNRSCILGNSMLFICSNQLKCFFFPNNDSTKSIFSSTFKLIWSKLFGFYTFFCCLLQAKHNALKSNKWKWRELKKEKNSPFNREIICIDLRNKTKTNREKYEWKRTKCFESLKKCNVHGCDQEEKRDENQQALLTRKTEIKVLHLKTVQLNVFSVSQRELSTQIHCSLWLNPIHIFLFQTKYIYFFRNHRERMSIGGKRKRERERKRHCFSPRLNEWIMMSRGIIETR